MTIKGKPTEAADFYVCDVCGELMIARSAPVRACRFCREPKPRAHFHVRCERCSPPGWWAVVRPVLVPPKE